MDTPKAGYFEQVCRPSTVLPSLQLSRNYKLSHPHSIVFPADGLVTASRVEMSES